MAEFPKQPERGFERTVSLHEGAVQRNVPWLISETQGVQIQNQEINSVGSRSRRRAVRSFGGVHAQVKPGGMAGYSDENFDEFLVGIWGSSIYKSDLDGGWAQQASAVSLIDGLLHQIVTGRQAGQLAYVTAMCERVTDTALGIAGRSQLVVYNIETDEATAASLAPRTVAIFQNRLFHGEDETIGWSEIGDLVSYSDINSILIEPGVGGEITAILPARDLDPKLWIFKEGAIFLFTPRWGTDSAIIPGAGDALDTINSSVRTLTQGVGCVATKSAAWVPGQDNADVLFLSADGIRSLNRADNDVQTGASFPLSWPIKAWIDRINFTQAHRAVAAVFDNAYHLAVPLDGAIDNTHVLRYDIENRSWTLHSWEARDLSSFQVASVDRLWMQNNYPAGDTSVTNGETDVSNHSHMVYSLYVGDIEPSTNITEPARVRILEESRSYTLQEPLKRKRWDRFTMQMSSSETSAIEVAYKADQGSWVPMTDMRISGTVDTVLFGVEPLPWVSSEDAIRRRTFSLSDVAPSYHLQIRLMTATQTTESGRLFFYFTEVSGHVLTDDYANDE
jgi:hypothetical protein